MDKHLSYDLPQSSIAIRPLANRMSSKLLVYCDGDIKDLVARDIVNEIPNDAVIVRNISKVIPARISINGGEIFLVEPVGRDYTSALQERDVIRWKCLVGKTKKVLGEHTLFDNSRVNVELVDGNYFVTFHLGGVQMAEVLNRVGSIPLPPYMKRDAEAEDSERYQTVFAEREGSVAAPTASLHFTTEIFQELMAKGVDVVDVVLHVGLGTFLPVKTDIESHIMHGEYFEVPTDTVDALYRAKRECRPIIAMGTTAFRVVESLAWARQWFDPEKNLQDVPQWIWRGVSLPEGGGVDGLRLLHEYCSKGRDSVDGMTRIMCIPGYTPQLCDGLITNFHQPESTLLQLVAAFIGDDWKNVYQHALKSNYRFLSYGDVSLLWKTAPVANNSIFGIVVKYDSNQAIMEANQEGPNTDEDTVNRSVAGGDNMASSQARKAPRATRRRYWCC